MQADELPLTILVLDAVSLGEGVVCADAAGVEQLIIGPPHLDGSGQEAIGGLLEAVGTEPVVRYGRFGLLTLCGLCTGFATATAALA